MNWWHWSATHLEALARLEHLAEARWPLAILSGPPGTGKSSVARFFVEEFRRSGREAAIVDAGLLGPSELEAELARELRTTGSALEELRSRIATEQPLVLVVDHATPRTETWVRFVDAVLGAGERAADRSLSVVVIGDRERLVGEWARSRSALRIDVDALGTTEVGAFVQSYFEWTGTAVPFDEAGIATIRSLTGGIPRQLEVLLSLTSVAAPVSSKPIWSSGEVQSMARETGLLQPHGTASHA